MERACQIEMNSGATMFRWRPGVRFLRNLTITFKFLLVPLVAAGGMLLLGAIFSNSLNDQKILLSRIADYHLVKIDKMSRLFSKLAANHVGIFNLLASADSGASEEQLYESGKHNLYQIHEITAQINGIAQDLTLNEQEAQLQQQLTEEMARYREVAISAIETATVNLALATQQMIKANKSYNEVNEIFLSLLNQVHQKSTTSIETMRHEANIRATHFGFIVLLGVIFIALITIWLAASLSGEIKSIAAVMAKLAEGDTSIEIPNEVRKDEIGTMVRAVQIFKGSLIQLSRSQADAMDLNRKLEEEIRKRTQAQEALRRANEELEVRIAARTAELAKSVEELRVLGEVSHAVNSVLDLETVLSTIVAKAVQLSATDAGAIYVFSKSRQKFRLRATYAMSKELIDAINRQEICIDDSTAIGQAAASRQPVQVPDLRDRPLPPFEDIILRSGYRALLIVPLLRVERIVGALVVRRKEPGLFPDGTVDRLQTFAAQSVLAIQNARLFSEIEEKSRALEAASHHKSQFLANMSHELRTPLNAIIGFTRLVMRRAGDTLPPKQQENLEKILASSEHLLSLINAVLDLSKIEAGRMELRPAECPLAPLLDLCLATVEPMLKTGRVRLIKDVEGPLTLFTDREKLKQILINLLSNAVKFTETGSITLRGRRLGEQVELAVADTGIGIPGAALELIFEEFRQVGDGGGRGARGGTGLGLSISRRLARMLGGDITVASEEDKGSTFTVIIPMRLAPSAPELPPIPAAGAPATGEVPLRPRDTLVLAIDDDPNVIYLLKENLADAGYRVIGAASGEEGLQKARELRPRAITLDIVMPGTDGWQVLHALKTDPVTRDIPVILVSIVDQKDLGFRLGATDYVIKPFDREALIGALARVAPRCRRILVVDDDSNVADLVRQWLEGERCAIDWAGDGVAGLERIVQSRPDVILLDLIMPRMDGLAFLDALQADAAHSDIPVIVLTAKSLTDADRQALQERVLGLIEKHGLDQEALIRQIRRGLLSTEPADADRAD
jgi:signal transduction histidine kinase/DNA-binding response OmpR family regulator/HAMP domain-containing protein